MKTVFIGMSGGVDSSAAALLLLRQGYAVVGVTLRLRDGRLAATAEAAGRDIADAARVCAVLGIEHRVLDLTDDFLRLVVDPFVGDYLSGRTPNPCVLCNRVIKFEGLLNYALANGGDLIATGHYAKTAYDPVSDLRQLFRTDSKKDQSYFLWRLTQHQLAYTLFPLAGMEKADIRRLAREGGLPVAEKSDSMETCFVPKTGHAAFIADYLQRKPVPGPFIDAAGNVLGEHRGIEFYTVGQRKGLGGFGRPLYVTRIDTEHNTVVLGEEGSQFSLSLTARDANYISISPPTEPFEAEMKIRYQAAPVKALVSPAADGFTAAFEMPQRSVAPGQSAVLYKGDLLLGGGVIM